MCSSPASPLPARSTSRPASTTGSPSPSTVDDKPASPTHPFGCLPAASRRASCSLRRRGRRRGPAPGRADQLASAPDWPARFELLDAGLAGVRGPRWNWRLPGRGVSSSPRTATLPGALADEPAGVGGTSSPGSANTSVSPQAGRARHPVQPGQCRCARRRGVEKSMAAAQAADHSLVRLPTDPAGCTPTALVDARPPGRGHRPLIVAPARRSHSYKPPGLRALPLTRTTESGRLPAPIRSFVAPNRPGPPERWNDRHRPWTSPERHRVVGEGRGYDMG